MLLTDWHVLATEGETIDGRVIEKQWLIDAAETYDPDYYEAVIDAEHDLEWFGSYGHVYDTRLGTSKNGETILEGRLRPNMRCIEQYQRGQRMHFSIWIEEDFRGTGKAYLFRLALTDQPASVGTSRLNLFSVSPRQNGKNNRFMTEPKPFSMSLEGDEASLFKKFMGWLKKSDNTDPASEPPETPQDNADMTPEQFEAIKQQNETLTNAINAQTQAFSALAETLKPAPADPATDPATDPADEPDPAQFTGDLAKTLEDIQNGQKELAEKFAKLETTAAPGTPEHAFTAPADGDDVSEVY